MDAKEFQAETKRIEKLLYHVAWSYLKDQQDVEDAVQDALLKAWEKQDTLRNAAHFKAWMTQILMNQCKNVLRKRKRWSFFPLEEATALVEPPRVEQPLGEALNRLKPEQRIAVTLFYVEGYTVQDIAETLGCPIGTVKTRLHSARKQLQKNLLVEWEES